MKVLFFQQLFIPVPSHKRSTAGNGKPGGGANPLCTYWFPVIFEPSAFGSMSANASGGNPKILPKTNVLTTAVPTKPLLLILLSLTVTLSAPTIKTPEPCGTPISKPFPGGAKLGRLLSFI